MDIKYFVLLLNRCEAQDGVEGYVTINSLRYNLQAYTWRPLHDDSSQLTQMLLSPVFRGVREPGQIDVCYLKLFALIHCDGSVQDKAAEFYNILQDGGQQDWISHSDKDIVPALRKMANLVTEGIFKLSGLAMKYNELELDKINDAINDMPETAFIEPVFGQFSRLNANEFKKKVA
jgi:hypothetical protein